MPRISKVEVIDGRSPTAVDRGRYRAPADAGYSARMHPQPVATFRHPDGSSWPLAPARG
jgi:hypothetical protein